jgi:hypothetical protein
MTFALLYDVLMRRNVKYFRVLNAEVFFLLKNSLFECFGRE